MRAPSYGLLQGPNVHLMRDDGRQRRIARRTGFRDPTS